MLFSLISNLNKVMRLYGFTVIGSCGLAVRRFVAINCALCIVHCALSQPLTLERAREMALEHNLRAQQAVLTGQLADEAVKQYRAMFLPDFSVNGGALYSTAKGNLITADLSPMTTALGGVLTQVAMQMPQLAGGFGALAGMIPNDITLDYKVGPVYAVGLTLKQPLYMGGKIRAAYKMAKQGRDMAVQSQRMTRVEVIEKTDDAYVATLRAGELAKVAERYLDMLSELERNVETAVKVGLKMPADQLRVQVKKNEVELQLRRAQNGLRLATMNLNHITGQPLSTATEVMPLDTTATAVTLAAQQSADARPEAILMTQRTEMASQQVRLARSEALPQLALLANVGYANGGEITLQGNDKKLMDGANFTGGVMLTVPIYHFGERTAKIRAAKLKMQMAQLEMADVNEQLQLALVQANNNMDEAMLELQLSARALQQAEESLRISRQQYEAGTLPLSEMLDMQAEWQKTYEQHIEAQCTVHTATTALQKAQGVLQ